jgi:hypothetical protein
VTIPSPYAPQRRARLKTLAPLPAVRHGPTVKTWLLSLLVIAGCAGSLTWLIRQKVIPAFLANANAERVADWYAGLTECRKETGSWPDPADPIKFGEQVFVVLGADGRRIPGGYMHGRPSFYNNGILYDIYKQPMRITVDGEKLTVASAGANMMWGDEDDVTSDDVQDRYRPTTLAQARAESEERTKKKK